MPVIEKLDALARTRTADESLAIIDQDSLVHMANMDIHFTHSTNGVAALHTEILKIQNCTAFMNCTRRNSTTRPTVLRSAAGCWNVIRD